MSFICSRCNKPAANAVKPIRHIIWRPLSDGRREVAREEKLCERCARKELKKDGQEKAI